MIGQHAPTSDVERLAAQIARLEERVGDLLRPTPLVRTYTPTLGGVTLGDGSIPVKRYSVDENRWVDCDVVVAFGTTSAVTGRVTISLPVEAAPGAVPRASAWFGDSGATNYQAFVTMDATTAYLDALNASTTYGSLAISGAGVPVALGNLDTIVLGIRYLAA